MLDDLVYRGALGLRERGISIGLVIINGTAILTYCVSIIVKALTLKKVGINSHFL